MIKETKNRNTVLDLVEYIKTADIFTISMCIYVICYPFEYIKLPGGLPITRIVFLFVGFAALLSLRRVRIARCPEVILPIILMVLLAWNVPNSQQPTAIALDGFTKYAGNISLLILCSVLISERSQFKLIACSYIMSSIIMLLFFLFNNGSYASQMESTRLVASIGGSTTDPNTFCLYFIPGLSYAFYRYLNGSGMRWCFLSIVFFFIPLYAGSRGSLLAYSVTLLAVAFFALIFNRRQVRTIILGVVVLLIIIVMVGFILSVLPEKTAERFSLDFILEHGDSGRSYIRENLWSSYLSFSLPNQLFGKGLRSTLLFSGVGLQAHNFWLETLIDLGMVGVIVMFGLHWISFSALSRMKNIWLLGCLVGIIVMELSLSINTSKTLWIFLTLGLLGRQLAKNESTKYAEH